MAARRAVGNNLLAQSVSRPCGRRKGIRTAQCVCSLFASSLILRNMSHDESRPEAMPRVVGRGRGRGRRVPSSAVHSGWMILWAYRPRHFQISPGGIYTGSLYLPYPCSIMALWAYEIPIHTCSTSICLDKYFLDKLRAIGTCSDTFAISPNFGQAFFC